MSNETYVSSWVTVANQMYHLHWNGTHPVFPPHLTNRLDVTIINSDITTLIDDFTALKLDYKQAGLIQLTSDYHNLLRSVLNNSELKKQIHKAYWAYKLQIGDIKEG